MRGDIEEVTTIFEVVYVDVSPSVAGALVTFVVEVLHADEVVLLSTAVFTRSEAVLLEADDLSYEGLESRLPLTFLEGSVKVGSVLRLSDDVVAEVNGSIDEGSIRLLDDVAEALGDHRSDDTFDVVFEGTHEGSADIWRCDIALIRDVDRVLRSFLVSSDTYDGLVVVFDRDVDTLSCIHWSRDVGEDLLDLSLRVVDIDVTDDDDCLQVGAVPLLIVVAQDLIGEAAYDLHLTDGEALPVLIAREGKVEELLHVAHIPAIAAAPFFFDDTTLSVDLLILEADEATPVVEYEDTAIDDALAWDGDLHQRVDRLVEARVSIDVATEAGTDALEEVDDSLAWEVLCAVEGDMLEEVSQTLLRVFFLHRAYLLGDIEFSSTLGLFIVTNEVGQTIGELSDTDGGVYGEWWHFAGGLGLSSRRQTQCGAYKERREEG